MEMTAKHPSGKKWTEEPPHQSQPSAITSFLSPCTFCCPSAPGNTGELLRGPGPIPGQARLQPTHQFSDHIAVPYLTPSSWAPQASPAPGPPLVGAEGAQTTEASRLTPAWPPRPHDRTNSARKTSLWLGRTAIKASRKFL